jgi:hypothetical protein
MNVQYRGFARAATPSWSGTRIRLNATGEPPLKAILDNSYMTAAANIISWDKAYAMFAKETFIEKKTYMLEGMSLQLVRQLRMYKKRGWLLEDELDEYDYESTTSLRHIRKVGDRFTWALSFPTTGVERSTQPDFVLEHATFGMTFFVETSGLRYSCIRICAHRHVALKHTFFSFHESSRVWVDAQRRLRRYAILGLSAIEASDCPDWFKWKSTPASDIYKFHHADAIVEVQKQADWRTFDEELAKWIDRWFQENQAEVLVPPPEFFSDDLAI